MDTGSESRGRPCRVIALLNQKGGVGKTTTTANLGAALGREGCRVLMVDLDPQAHLTIHLGVDPNELESSVYHLLTDDDADAQQLIRTVEGHENLSLLPAEVNLAGAETELAPKMVTGSAQRVLRDRLAGVLSGDGEKKFDYVLIDCPPSLGLLTINALTTASEVVVPMQAHFLALQGLSKLLETVQLIRQGFNPSLRVTGMVLCMHEAQTILASEVVADVKAFLDAGRSLDVPWRQAVVFDPPIRRNIKLAESPSFGKTIYDYAPTSNGADDYRKLAASVIAAGVGQSA
ncbi:MAG: AAA family ATPase [Phycisphaera sp.]|nr:AAA family ATPase [Phycisphaera sp.]